MNSQIHNQIIEGVEAGEAIDIRIMGVYLSDISYWEEACTIYGPGNGSGRILGETKDDYDEYLSYFNCAACNACCECYKNAS